MLCPSCGKEIKDGARFCGLCGARVDASAPQQPTPPAAAPVERGPLAAAWHDITSSPDWVKRSLLLMAMKCVPVLGVYATGYNLQWGAAAATGDSSPLPRGTFTTRTLLAGLCGTVINVVFAAMSAVLFLLNIIPLLGWIASFVISLLVSAFCSLTLMRMAVFESLGAAGELSDTWRAFKGRSWSLVAAACLPGIIVTGCFAVAVLLLVMFSMFSAVADGGYLIGYGAFGSGLIRGIVAVMGGGVILLVVLYAFFGGLTEMWSLRSVGHWVARNVPEWPAAAKAAGEKGVPAGRSEASGSASAL